MPTQHLDERELIGRARRGDKSSYGALVERDRGELHAHADRVLGSVHDADDATELLSRDRAAAVDATTEPPRRRRDLS